MLADEPTKTKIGCYCCESNEITIYIGWLDVHPMEEIAIHEYAHHIHVTEKMKDYRLERPHGKELLATTSKGLFFSINGGRMWMRRNR